MPEENREAEFNMNMATLIRIDNLIKAAHSTACNTVEGVDNLFSYDNILDRIFVEAVTKFSKEEEKKCIEFQSKVLSIKTRWGNDLYTKFYHNCGKILNSNYHISRGELKITLREYEIFLMKAMEKHGMLLKDARSGMEKFTGGGKK